MLGLMSEVMMNKRCVKGELLKAEDRFLQKTIENLKEISAIALERQDGRLKTTDFLTLKKFIR